MDERDLLEEEQEHTATIPESPLPEPTGAEASEETLERIMADMQIYGDHEGKAWYIASKGAAAWAVGKVAKLRSDQAENERIAVARGLPLKRQIEEIQAWLANENGSLGYEIAFFEAHLERYHRTLFEAASEKERAKLKTIKLPEGALQLRAQQPEVEYDDAQLIEWAKGLLRSPGVDPEEARAYLHRMVDVVAGNLTLAAPEEPVSVTAVLDALTALVRAEVFGANLSADTGLIRTKEELNKNELKQRIEFRPASEVPDGRLVAIDTETGETIPGITALERRAKFNVDTNKTNIQGGK